jgi:hypothetical protein
VENGPRQYPEAEYARVRDRSIASLTGVLDRLARLARPDGTLSGPGAR